MKPAVFVSHAAQDKEAVAKLCTDLQVAGVDTWASFKDIQPGAVWNKAIEAALDAATHVIVVATQASIGSDYVGAEVEWALDNGKKVIPVLIEKVRLPVRWHTLQYADLTPSENRDPAWQALTSQLPKNARNQLLSLLDAQAPIEPIREFLWNNPQVISHSAVSQSEVRTLAETTAQANILPRSRRFEREDVLDFIQQQVLTDILANVDFFDVQPVTVYRYKLVYLLSPVPPFDASGNQTDELKASLEDAEKAMSFPNFITQTSFPYQAGAEITALIVAGRRHHYQGNILEQRMALVEKWASTEWRNRTREQLRRNREAMGQTEEAFLGCYLEMHSYDHLVEQL